MKTVLALLLFITLVCVNVQKTYAGDGQAEWEFFASEWVKDAYISPAYMNLGVLRGQEDWNSHTFRTWACDILKRNNSRLTRVRLTDIEAVAYQGKSPREAEIVKFKCK